MSISAIRSAVPAALASPGRLDALVALAASLMFVASHAARGFPTLADSGGDNDSVMRLVQVRDLLAGQAWFDTMQYRLGLEGGASMHWSRLVDAPLALLVAAFGEAAALVAWPAAMFGLSLWLIVRSARFLGGEWAVLPAAAVGGLALWFAGIFRPGAIDHHNLQLVLALATLYLLLRSRERALAGAGAGATAALMLAVGMETAPYVAVACAAAAVLFLVGDRVEARAARGFGASFAGFSMAVMAVTVAPRDWLATHCDAFSLPQASLALLGGGGLFLIASTPALAGTPGRRLAALAGLGLLAAALLVVAFPQCIAAPYSDLDPRLYSYLIERITEAQPFMAILRSDPARIFVYYATPFIALCTVAWAILGRGPSRGRLLAGAFLASAFAVSLWQVRGSTFTIPLAAIPLAVWIAAIRREAIAAPTLRNQLAMAAAWLVSFNLLWQLGATLIAPPDAPGEGDAASQCYAHADYAGLAALPAGTVAAVTNLGSSILANTPHRALAAPYHRNEAGLIANLDLMTGAPEETEALARQAGVDYLAMCGGNTETASLAAWVPDGLAAALLAGEAPAWLAPVDGTQDSPLRVWQVVEPR